MPTWQGQEQLHVVQCMPTWQDQAELLAVQRMPARQDQAQLLAVQRMPTWQDQEQLRAVQRMPAQDNKPQNLFSHQQLDRLNPAELSILQQRNNATSCLKACSSLFPSLQHTYDNSSFLMEAKAVPLQDSSWLRWTCLEFQQIVGPGLRWHEP